MNEPAAATEYAGLAWRVLALVVDTAILFMFFAAVVAVAAGTGALDLEKIAAADPLTQTVAPWWLYAVSYGMVFVYYTVFEIITAASPGKMAFNMRVATDEGKRPGAWAIVVRNLVRLPEVLFWYLPAGASCLMSPKRQRFGDYAAHTVVVRTAREPLHRGPARGRRGPAALRASVAARRSVSPAPAPLAPRARALEESLADLRAAAFTAYGAHHLYLRLSGAEIDRGGGLSAAFSPEYTASWHTLADAVVALQHAGTAAEAVAVGEGTTLENACGAHPDLALLCRDLAPYFSASSDEKVHEAYMEVARSDAAGAAVPATPDTPG